MQDTTADLFLAMSITFAIFGVCYFYLSTRNRERMTLLEKGLPKNYFNDNSNYLPFVLLLGIVSIGISFGVITGAFLESVQVGVHEHYMFAFSLFLFLGISLIVSYFVLNTTRRKRND